MLLSQLLCSYALLYLDRQKEDYILERGSVVDIQVLPDV